MLNMRGSPERRRTDGPRECLSWVINATAHVLLLDPPAGMAFSRSRWHFTFANVALLSPPTIWPRLCAIPTGTFGGLQMFIDSLDHSINLHCIVWGHYQNERAHLSLITVVNSSSYLQFVNTWWRCWRCLDHGPRLFRSRCPLWRPRKQPSW